MRLQFCIKYLIAPKVYTLYTYLLVLVIFKRKFNKIDILINTWL